MGQHGIDLVAQAEPGDDPLQRLARTLNRMLDRIAAWCEQFTPIVALDPPHGLFLDITGCAHLQGGEAAMLEIVRARLKTQGFVARAAIAPNPGAAFMKP